MSKPIGLKVTGSAEERLGQMSMPPLYPMREIPDVPVEQCTSDALIKRVQKLRWMGFENEARETQRTLREAAEAGSVHNAPN